VLTGTTYGVVGAFPVVVAFATERAGKQLDSIGWYNSLLFVPTFLLFLYAPIVDIGPRRKHWLVIVATIGAACMFAAFQMQLPDQIPAYLTLGFTAQLISGLVGSCSGGLMAASLPDELRGKASGWYNVGNLSGGGLFAALEIELLGDGVDPRLLGAIAAAMMVLPVLVMAIRIDEPPRPHAAARQVFRQTLREVGGVVLSRSGLTGIALSLSPVGTVALSNYFSGMSTSYGVSPRIIAVVTLISNVGMNALGALVGGYLGDRLNRRVLYLIGGTLSATCAIVMALSPASATTYVIGVITYALITGFCYAAFTAYVLETIGKSDRTAATKYSLFTAAANIAITYVGFIDTRFYEHHGVAGVVASDAAFNLIGVVVLGLVFWRLGSFGKWRHPSDPEPAGELPSAVARVVDE
jgi:MFS family permease